MDSVFLFKNQVAAVYRIMSQDTSERIDNLLIAQLNHVAYKAIRKGVQKKLDERAIKNEDLYKKLDAQLDEASKNWNFDKIEESHGEAMRSKLGDCPMSQCSVVELMQSKDCMCLGLSIARSQATISDPTKLVIKDVFPVYMGLDSFLESSIYNLKINEDAAGGFDLNEQGKLAVGAGRESISGLLPLYLFKEHWELARRKIQPLFGFMCTLEPLGYASSQYFTVPFLVLIKAMEKYQAEPSESNAQILELVHETCANIIASNNTFRGQTIESVIGFLQNPLSRTADAVADIPVLTAQTWCYSRLPEEQKQIQSNDPQAEEETKSVEPEQMKKYSRYAVEEMMRRRLKRAEPLGKTAILDQLVPGYKQISSEYAEAFQEKLNQSLTQQANGAGDQYGQYAA